MRLIKAYVVTFKKQDAIDYPEIKIFRRRYDAEKYLSDNNWYEASDGRWFNPLLTSEARIEKFVF